MKDASKWLEEHQFALEPEELVSEEDKQSRAFQTDWPTPKEPPNLGIFSQITTSEGFNRVIGCPANWETVREDKVLFDWWVLPHAVLLFGRTWFDRMKWAPSVTRSGTFPLFSCADKDGARNSGTAIEKTPAGKARISQIIERTAHALRVYLAGKWYVDEIKPPSGYITEAIKNQMIRSVADDLGYKLKHVPACPFCLSRGRKTAVQRHSDHQVSCDICNELYMNIKLNANNAIKEGKFDGAVELYGKLLAAERFRSFSSLMAICPCSKYVPVSCLDYNYGEELVELIERTISRMRIPKTTQTTIPVPNELKGIHLRCPHCENRFEPKTFTGLPSISIWQNLLKSIDEPNRNGTEIRDLLADANMEAVQENINNKQRLKVLIDELVLKLSRTSKNSVSSLGTWYFYLAAILWMRRYPSDASAYLFDSESSERLLTDKERVHSDNTTKRFTHVSCGQGTSVHQAIFYIWVDLLEKNIRKFRLIDPSIKKLSDFGWFCSRPKFSEGPKSNFTSVVELNEIANNSRAREIGSDVKPRIVKVISIYRIRDGLIDFSRNFAEDIKALEWQSICLNQDTGLKNGDQVRVSVLLMSGHPTHAPIQRILRLRKHVLQSVIDKILMEENGHTFQSFWLSRNKLVKEAYRKLGSLQELGEEY